MPEGAPGRSGNSWNPFSELEVRPSVSVTLKGTLQITRLDRVLYESNVDLTELKPFRKSALGLKYRGGWGGLNEKRPGVQAGSLAAKGANLLTQR